MVAIMESNQDLPASTLAKATAQSPFVTVTASKTASSSETAASTVAASTGPSVRNPRQCAICIVVLSNNVPQIHCGLVFHEPCIGRLLNIINSSMATFMNWVDTNVPPRQWERRPLLEMQRPSDPTFQCCRVPI
eukprot:IDg5911t1